MTTDTPPTDAELRESANRWYDCECQSEPGFELCQDCINAAYQMARHILATVGTDDDPTHLNAENSRIRELLTNAYTVKPLEWVPCGTEEWFASSGTGFTVRRHSTVEGKWVLYVGAMCMWREFDTPHAAKNEAEKMHIARVTTRLTKIKVPS